MNKAILIHGTCDKDEYFNDKYPSLSNSHWFPWLQKQLLIKGINTQTPEMPNAYNPNYLEWKEHFERFEIDEETILIGHSCGGGFIIRWLSENNIHVGNVILVAPWLDPERKDTDIFFEFKIDKDVYKRTKKLEIYLSNDEQDVIDSVNIIMKVLPKTKLTYLKNMGHFTYSEMEKHNFPELLNSALQN